MQSAEAITIEVLVQRLAELSWKLQHVGAVISLKSIPAGVFRCSTLTSPQAYIDEIKEDLMLFRHGEHNGRAYYLAKKIQQKITILVRLCHLHRTANTIKKTTPFGLEAMSTRQQWLQHMQAKIEAKKEQQLALKKCLTRLAPEKDAAAILDIQAALGELERQLITEEETIANGLAHLPQ